MQSTELSGWMGNSPRLVKVMNGSINEVQGSRIAPVFVQWPGAIDPWYARTLDEAYELAATKVNFGHKCIVVEVRQGSAKGMSVLLRTYFWRNGRVSARDN